MSLKRCLSTGVIKRSSANVDAHIEIVNLSNKPVSVCVLGFNWDSNPPVALAVFPGSPLTIPANSNQPFDIPLNTVANHYEVRLSLPNCYDVIANVFALDAAGNVIAGNTVLFEDLVPISKCLACCQNKKFYDYDSYYDND